MSGSATPYQGLSAGEVRARVASGQVNGGHGRAGRSAVDILRANVFTWFNLLLGALCGLMLTFGSWRDALFGILLVVNTAIGVIQEMRAKLTLERLSLVSAPRVRAVRQGQVVDISSLDVVLDDVIMLAAGDQLVVDATVLESAGLEVDESLLTGESVPVVKGTDNPLMAGSFVVAGSGVCRATAVGAASYARQIETQGRRFSRASSDIMGSINRLLRGIGIAIVPVAAFTMWRDATSTAPMADRVTNLVGPLVAMVPEGLVLLSSIAFALSAIRLAREHVLVQELPSVEGLARTDVLCSDKTGTLTEPSPRFAGVEVAEGSSVSEEQARTALRAVAWADQAPNATLGAVRSGLAAPQGWVTEATVPFASSRKWSAADFGENGIWVLGAPDVVLADNRAAAPVLAHASALASEGVRVLALARSQGLPDREGLPRDLEAVALALLAEQVRPDAADTVRYLDGQGVRIKIISGDDPRTVSRIAAATGVPDADRYVDARSLSDADTLAHAMATDAVLGRVMPEQKSAMIASLQRDGHVVTMIGDGVNDVLALKQADLGVAMGSGSGAAKAVARVVLLDDRFAHMPQMVAEGRRVTANAERVAKLFVTKSAWALLVALAVAALHIPYPFLPRQLTLAGSLTIGVPAFFLALAPSDRRYEPGLLRRVLRFAGPSGLIVASAVTGVFLWSRGAHLGIDTARTLCTIVLATVGLGAIVVIEWPVRGWHLGIVAAMAAGISLVFLWPFGRNFFALQTPSMRALTVCAVVSAAAIAGIACVCVLDAATTSRSQRR